MRLKVTKIFEFGNWRYYPKEELATALLKIMKRKSFTRAQLNALEGAGFEIRVIYDGDPEEWRV